MKSKSIWLKRGIVGILLLISYIKIGKPIRIWITDHFVLTMVHKIEMSKDDDPPLKIKKVGAGFNIQNTSNHTGYSYDAPAGFFFIMPAILMILLFDRWKLLLGFFLFHLTAGLLSTLIYLLGIAYSTILLNTGDFLIYTLIPAISLAWVPMIYALGNEKALAIDVGEK